MAEQMTKKEIAASIDWFGDEEDISWSGADWSRADETGEVRLEGRTYYGDLIDVTVTIGEPFVRPDLDSA